MVGVSVVVPIATASTDAVNDNYNDHSFSQFPVHKALAPGALHSDLLPFELKVVLHLSWKETCYIQYECVMRNGGSCFFGRVLIQRGLVAYRRRLARRRLWCPLRFGREP